MDTAEGVATLSVTAEIAGGTYSNQSVLSLTFRTGAVPMSSLIRRVREHEQRPVEAA